MCLIKGAFVGTKKFDVIKMHGITIKIIEHDYSLIILPMIQYQFPSSPGIINTIHTFPVPNIFK
jgi:hypothetical protein